MTCAKCDSQALSSFPADVRLYLNGSRTISAPPMNPSPKITVCLNCGHSEFSIPPTWLASGWLRPLPAPVYHSFGANGRDDIHIS
jgi:hypothetical protein